jgi:spermidine/putrescine transport system permease protein
MRRPAAFSPLSIYYGLITLILFLPILLLIVFSFNDSTQLVFPLKGFTTRWYGQLLKNDELLRAVRTSIFLGLGSSLVATAMGAMGAIVIVRFNFPGKSLFVSIAALPLFRW